MRDSQPNYNKGYFTDGPYLKYDYAELTVSGGVTNYDVKEDGGLFVELVQGRYLEISTSGADIYLKMNGSGNKSIPLVDGADSWVVADFVFENLYLTNETGSDATVILYMMGHR